MYDICKAVHCLRELSSYLVFEHVSLTFARFLLIGVRPPYTRKLYLACTSRKDVHPALVRYIFIRLVICSVFVCLSTDKQLANKAIKLIS